MNEKEIQLKIENEFSCRGCSECCRKPGYVYLRDDEAQAIADFLGRDIRVFMEEFCEILDRRRIVLKKKVGETCIFLENDACRVHPAKPGQCRDFPFKWRTPASFNYCHGLQELFPSKNSL